MKSVIELNSISKHYYTEDVETRALIDVALNIYEGDYISISGPSGCGKSTLLNILGVLDLPTKGVYKLAGEPVQTLGFDQHAELRNKYIGFVFQSFNLLDDISVFDNVALPLKYSSEGLNKKQIQQLVDASLEKVEMGHRKHHRPNQLSGGQQQRVAIARALVNQPKVLLVDEPTGNLDSKNGDAVMDLLDELNANGTTICMVTHDPRYAYRAKRQVRLLDGEIIEQQKDESSALSEQSSHVAQVATEAETA